MSQQFKKTRIASYVCMALSASITTNAFAEEAEKKNKLDDIEIIEVTGVRSSLTSALNAKRDSETISDSIIAEEIGKSSDENIAQALSRISGVSLDRDGGDNQTVTVRGVQAALNDIKLNGVSMTSNTDDQAVDLSLFSADILSRIDVVKSPSANQEEGSLGASINLHTRAPLSANKNTSVFTIEARYNDLREESTPRFSYTGMYKLSDNMGIAGSLFHDTTNARKEEFTTNGTLRHPFTGAINAETGDVLAAGGYVQENGEDKIDPVTGLRIPFGTWAAIPDAALAKLSFDDKTKQGGTFTFQYRPSDVTDIRFDGSFSRQEIEHTHSQIRLNKLDRNNGANKAQVAIQLGDDNTANHVVSAFTQFPGTLNQAASWLNTTDTLVLGLEVEHAIGDDWIVKGRIGHSDTEQAFTDSMRVNWAAKGGKNKSTDPNDWCGINYTNGPEGDVLPEFSFCNHWNTDDPDQMFMQQARVEIRDVKDAKDSIYFDATRGLDNDYITSVEFGVKYTDRSKSVTADEDFKKFKEFDNTAKIFASDVDGIEGSSITEGYFLDGIAPLGMPTDWLFPDVDASIALAYPEGISSGTFSASPLKSWEVEEITYGAYVQANFELLDGDITGNFGVRYAKTEIEANTTSGYEFPAGVFPEADAPGGKIEDANSDEHDYAEFLPSFTLNYFGIDDVVLRASAARVLARPNINSLNPNFHLTAKNVNATPTAKGGNTRLDPFLADQFDLSAEWYFEEGALLSAALFYKDFKSFTYKSSDLRDILNPITDNCVIDRSLIDPEVDDPTDPELTAPCASIKFATTINGGSAEIKGLEVAYQQHYDFLPGLLSHLGSSVNYTYADSEAIVDPENVNNPNNGLPFINTSKHSANATVYWENDDMSFRLAYAYRTKALTKLGSTSSQIRDDRGTLDFSANFDVTKALKVTFSATNLTDTYDKIIDVITDPADTGLTKEFSGNLSNVSEDRVRSIYNYGRNYRLSMRYRF